jgi:hypothetical protein
MQTVDNGRTFELTTCTNDMPNLRAELIRNGWDGYVYFGVSKPAGSQRKEFEGMFYRSATTGEFRRAA